MEIWKNVIEFEGLYLVSNKGTIKRHPNAYLLSNTHIKEHIIKPHINHCGYYYVDLCKNGKKTRKTIHQLVATAFIPNFHYGDLINHIDGNKLNNNLNNLEKTTTRDNELHKYANNLGKKSGDSKYNNVYLIL